MTRINKRIALKPMDGRHGLHDKRVGGFLPAWGPLALPCSLDKEQLHYGKLEVRKLL